MRDEQGEDSEAMRIISKKHKIDIPYESSVIAVECAMVLPFDDPDGVDGDDYWILEAYCGGFQFDLDEYETETEAEDALKTIVRRFISGYEVVYVEKEHENLQSKRG